MVGGRRAPKVLAERPVDARVVGDGLFDHAGEVVGPAGERPQPAAPDLVASAAPAHLADRLAEAQHRGEQLPVGDVAPGGDLVERPAVDERGGDAGPGERAERLDPDPGVEVAQDEGVGGPVGEGDHPSGHICEEAHPPRHAVQSRPAAVAAAHRPSRRPRPPPEIAQEPSG